MEKKIKQYETPEMAIHTFILEDVVRTSTPGYEYEGDSDVDFV